jgi:hypothetical protein
LENCICKQNTLSCFKSCFLIFLCLVLSQLSDQILQSIQNSYIIISEILIYHKLKTKFGIT